MGVPCYLWYQCSFIQGMYGHGLEYAARPGQVSFFDSLYFSIVTISSLGYGDIHPVSYSKAIACTEVILGLVIIGLVISKVASERTGYLLRRIYSSDVQKRLKYFSDSIYDFNNGLSEDTSLNDEDWTEVVNRFFAVVWGAKKYIGFEVYHKTMFDLVPPKAIRIFIDSISSTLKLVVQQGIERGMTGKPLRTVKNTLKTSKSLAFTIARYSRNEELDIICKKLRQEIVHHKEQMREYSKTSEKQDSSN